MLALFVMSVANACDEDGKPLPATCAGPLPLDDIGNAGSPDVNNPCLTPIGDAVSFVTSGTPTPGTSSGGKGGSGNQNAGGMGDAGAGGA
jgi:hypothetical protein